MNVEEIWEMDEGMERMGRGSYSARLMFTARQLATSHCRCRFPVLLRGRSNNTPAESLYFSWWKQEKREMDEKHNFPLFFFFSLVVFIAFVVLCNSKIIKGEDRIFVVSSMRRRRSTCSFLIPIQNSSFGLLECKARQNMCKVEIESWWCWWRRLNYDENIRKLYIWENKIRKKVFYLVAKEKAKQAKR